MYVYSIIAVKKGGIIYGLRNTSKIKVSLCSDKNLPDTLIRNK